MNADGTPNIGLGELSGPKNDGTPAARGGEEGRVVAPRGGVPGTMIPGKPETWKPLTGNRGTWDMQRYERERGQEQSQKDVESLGQAGQEARFPRGDQYTDDKRPEGNYTITVDGKDVRRRWDGSKWLAGDAGDARAAEIRAGEGLNPENVKDKVLDAGAQVIGGAVGGTSATGRWLGDLSRMFTNPQIGIRGKDGNVQRVTVGNGYPAQLNGQWGYKIYKEDGTYEFRPNENAKDGKEVQNVIDYVRGEPIENGPGDQEIKIVDDPQLQDPDDKEEDPGDKGDDTGDPGDKGDDTGDDTGDPGDQTGDPGDRQPERQLTPMQQWAQKYPHLADKVKPGQAGYDEIRSMRSGTGEDFSDIGGRLGTALRDTQNQILQDRGIPGERAARTTPAVFDTKTEPAVKPLQQQQPKLDTSKVTSPTNNFRQAPSGTGIGTELPRDSAPDKLTQARQQAQATINRPQPGTPGKMVSPMRQTVQQNNPGLPKPPKAPKMDRIDKATSGIKPFAGIPEETMLRDLMGDLLDEGRGLAAGKSDYDKMRDRNAAAGMTPGNSYATAQRRMRSGMLRGKKKERGAVTGKPNWMTDEQWQEHKKATTKADLARKHPGTAAGKRAADNDAMDRAELGGTKNNRGS